MVWERAYSPRAFHARLKSACVSRSNSFSGASGSPIRGTILFLRSLSSFSLICQSDEVAMQRAFVSVFLVILSLATIVASSSASDPILAFRHVNVIDATGSPVRPDMTVVVEGQRIVNLGKAGDVQIPKSAKIVDAAGKLFIPGLWDMHVHTIFGDWIPKDEKIMLPLFVANGVTGVRDMGGDLEAVKQWRSQIAAGKLLGPRMIVAGPMLDGPTPRFP